MRVINFIISLVVILFGLAVATLVMIAGLLGFFVRRLFGRPAQVPHFSPPPRAAGRRSPLANRPDVIDVEATLVKE